MGHFLPLRLRFGTLRQMTRLLVTLGVSVRLAAQLPLGSIEVLRKPFAHASLLTAAWWWRGALDTHDAWHWRALYDAQSGHIGATSDDTAMDTIKLIWTAEGRWQAAALPGIAAASSTEDDPLDLDDPEELGDEPTLHPAFSADAPHAAHVSLCLPVSESVRLTLHDGFGQQLAVLHEGILKAGIAYLFSIEATAYPAGKYAIRAKGRTFSAEQPLILLGTTPPAEAKVPQSRLQS